MAFFRWERGPVHGGYYALLVVVMCWYVVMESWLYIQHTKLFLPYSGGGDLLDILFCKGMPCKFLKLSNPKASKKQPLCAKIFKKISEDTPTSTSVLHVSCKMFSPTWIVEVSSRTKSVERVITVQPSLPAMLLHSFELNHQPKYVSSHKNGKRNKQNSPSHTV